MAEVKSSCRTLLFSTEVSKLAGFELVHFFFLHLLLVGVNPCNTIAAFEERLPEYVWPHLKVKVFIAVLNSHAQRWSEKLASEGGARCSNQIGINGPHFSQTFLWGIHGRKYDILEQHRSHREEAVTGHRACKIQNFVTRYGSLCPTSHVVRPGNVSCV